MGYIVAYLLLALAVDLILTIIKPEREQPSPLISQRRLWNDTICDCRSIMLSDGTASFNHTRWPISDKRQDRR
jgi:hypothetical protein